jgi:hypothetical protein
MVEMCGAAKSGYMECNYRLIIMRLLLEKCRLYQMFCIKARIQQPQYPALLQQGISDTHTCMRVRIIFCVILFIDF